MAILLKTFIWAIRRKYYANIPLEDPRKKKSNPNKGELKKKDEALANKATEQIGEGRI